MSIDQHEILGEWYIFSTKISKTIKFYYRFLDKTKIHSAILAHMEINLGLFCTAFPDT